MTSMHMHMDRSECGAVPSAIALLRSARDELAATDCEASAGGKYVAAHLAASRAAVAVVAARGAGVTTRGRVSRSVWELLRKWSLLSPTGLYSLLQVQANALRPRQVCRVLYRCERQMTCSEMQRLSYP